MTIRFKLTMGAIAVILVANSLLSLVNVVSLENAWFNEVQTRVRWNLNSARAAFRNHAEQISRSLAVASLDEKFVALRAELGVKADTETGAAPSDQVASATQTRAREVMCTWVRRLQETMAIDFVDLLDADANVICRSPNDAKHGDSLSSNPLVAEAIQQKKPIFGTVLLSGEALAREGAALADQAKFTLLPTPAACPTDDKVRTDGMVVAAAVPVLNGQGQVEGVLFGGDLLNRRYELVDQIKQEVFPGDTYEGKDIGTVTIFQGDLRIATNVFREDGSRAVGTRLSEKVYKEVIERGGTWAAPAFVVNDWYITAYEPIRDPQQRIIGALYVGLLRAPFAHARTSIVTRFIILMVMATVASLALIFLMTMVVMRPIGRIVEMSRQVIAGDLTARVGIRPAGEMGVLCEAVDGMADAVAQREIQLTQATRQQVTRAEKLASIGRLAAGVAHEINNPLTGVLTFAHLMREKPNMDAQDKQDLDLIVHETTRAADIVRGLLDFARERPTLMEQLDLNDVVHRTVRLIINQKKFEKIVIDELLLEDLPAICGDRNQLQQVLLNLSLNACAAMPQGGKLTISTLVADDKVLMKVTDTGCGIKKEDLDSIFEPFFTTQPVGKGTGLGLSVTYGIVEQHGGTLEVQSKEGEGTTFTIRFPMMNPS